MTALIRCGFIGLTPRDADENFVERRGFAVLLEDPAGYFDRRSGGDDLTVFEKDDFVAHPLDFVHIVRGIQNRRPEAPLEFEEDLSHQERRLNIEVCSR